MKTIWKYEVPESGREFTMPIPRGARILCVQVQAGIPCIWAEVETDVPVEPQNFMIVGTGHPAPYGHWKYVGTWQSGAFVWHLYAG